MVAEENRYRVLVRRFEGLMCAAAKDEGPVTFNLGEFFFQILENEVLVSGSAISALEDEWTVDLHAAPLEVLRDLMSRRADILAMVRVEVEKTVQRKAFIEEADALERWLDEAMVKAL